MPLAGPCHHHHNMLLSGLVLTVGGVGSAPFISCLLLNKVTGPSRSVPLKSSSSPSSAIWKCQGLNLHARRVLYYPATVLPKDRGQLTNLLVVK